MSPFRLQKQLQSNIGKRLKLRINDNRVTMLSVRWESNCTTVSLHRMFLQAPRNVMDALACYIRRDHKIISPNIKLFIEENIKKLDYTHLLQKKNLCTQGAVYNLQQIYIEINKEYFNNELNLFITWFGKHHSRKRSKITFGLFQDPLRLVKIHRILDSPTIPEYVISYVVFHEMLHYVCPSYCDSNGYHHIHSKEFKEKEKTFRYYHLAKKWIKDHQEQLFQ